MNALTKEVFDAYTHQHLPYEAITRKLQTRRTSGHDPLFQVVWTYQTISNQSIQLPNVIIEKGPQVIRDKALFDLESLVVDDTKGARIRLIYNSAAFSNETIERMISSWETLIRSIIQEPGRRIGELSLLSGAERRQIIEGLNQTAFPTPAGSFAHDLFAQQARLTPTSLAVLTHNQSLTYGELNRQANQLAHYLRRLGVAPELRVGACLERGPELVVTLLGILKAGGVYVPLDPHYPAERLAYMLEDAQITVLLTQARLRDKLPKSRARLICLDEAREEIARESGDDPQPLRSPAQLAYAIYTSGSTGRPKGALIEHRGLLNHLWAKIIDLGLGPQDVVAQNASCSFDISVWQMLAALLTGGAVRVIGEEDSADPQRLLEAVEAGRVSVLETVPALLAAMVQEQSSLGERRLKLKSLRWMISNAEALPGGLAEQWLALYPEMGLINAYGPTECSDDVTHCHLSAGWKAQGAYVSLGRPLLNQRLYVLDEEYEPAPIGVAGEIYVGGAGVGRGYLNRPDLTAERFLPHPFASEPGARLYRTGDIGRWLADGQLDYLGRSDHQVKLRGHRIELGEVESALLAHGGVRQAAAVIVEPQPRDKRLAAYVVAAAEDGLELDKLRDYLREKLPEYMVPGAVVLLDHLPLTPNGKLDRKALPEPDWGLGESEVSYTGPRNPVEEILAGIWAEVLQRDRVGVHDNFFELGGHSLLATQVTSRMRKALEVEAPLRWIFEAPTVEGLARLLEGGRREIESDAPPLVKVERSGPLPLSFAQQRLWFIDQLEPGTAVYNVPFAVRLSGSLEVGVLIRSLSEIVRRHEALRTSFPSEGGRPVQVIAPAEGVKLPVIDLSQVSEGEEAVRSLAGEEALRPFDLSRGPLLRTILLRRGPEEHVLLVTMHHVVSDGWSVGVMIREFTQLYEAFRAGRRSPLGELGVQYGDFAVWQREWLKGERLKEQLEYWRRQLEGAQALELPTDYRRPAQATHRGGSVELRLGAELTEGLRALSRREGVTLFMTLLAGFQILLSRYSGQEEVAVGTPIANRNRAETEGLIGFFVNTLVIRTNLEGDPEFQRFLKQIRETVLGGFDRQDVPFERIVEELSIDRQRIHSPLFTVLFTLHNESEAPLNIEGLVLEPLSLVSKPVPKFDLALELIPSDEDIIALLY